MALSAQEPILFARETKYCSRRREYFCVFFSYLALLTALFLPALLAGRAVFNIGGWHVVFAANFYANFIVDFILGQASGSAFYPVGHPLAFGEPLPLAAMLYLLLKGLLNTDFWAVHALIFILQAISAFGVYLLSKQFVGSRIFCWLAGFFYGFNNYYFATIDDFICTSYCALPFVALYLLQFVQSGKHKPLLIAALLGGIQVYQSVYVFVFQSAVIGLITALLLFVLPKKRALLLQGLGAYLLLSFFIALPEFLVLVRNLWVFDPFDPGRPAGVVTYVTGLRLFDFFRFLPETLLYPGVDWLDLPPNPWAADRRHAGIGLLLPIAAIFGLFAVPNRYRFVVASTIGAAVLLAMGPRLHLPGWTIDSPLFAFYSDVPILRFMRVPSRAYFVAIMVMAILAAVGLERLARRVANQPNRPQLFVAVALVAAIFFAIENIPFPPRTFAIKQHFENLPTLEDKYALSERSVVLNLPSNLMWNVIDADRDVPGYAREFIYMYQQVQLGFHTVNGASGYIPYERFRLEPAIKQFPDFWATEELRQVGVTHVIFHRQLAVDQELRLLERLLDSPELELVGNDGRFVIFLLKPRV